MPGADAAGTFAIGGEIVNRLGLARCGSSAGVGEPADRASVVEQDPGRIAGARGSILSTPPTFVWPNVPEALIREVLHPYPGMLVATKAGYARPGPGHWATDGRFSTALRRCARQPAAARR